MKTNLMLTIMLLAFALVCPAQEQQESKNIAKEIERFLGSKKLQTKKDRHGPTMCNYYFRYILDADEMGEKDFVPAELIRLEKVMRNNAYASTEWFMHSQADILPKAITNLSFERPDDYKGTSIYTYMLDDIDNYRYVTFAQPDGMCNTYLLVWKNNRFIDKDGNPFASVDGYILEMNGNQWKINCNTMPRIIENKNISYVKQAKVVLPDTTQYAKLREKISYLVRQHIEYANKQDSAGLNAVAYYLDELCKNYRGTVSFTQFEELIKIMSEMPEFCGLMTGADGVYNMMVPKHRSNYYISAINTLSLQTKKNKIESEHVRWSSRTRDYGGGILQVSDSKMINETFEQMKVRYINWHLTGNTDVDHRFIKITSKAFTTEKKLRFDDGKIDFLMELSYGSFVELSDGEGGHRWMLVVDGVDVDIDMATGELRRGSETNRRFIEYQKQLDRLMDERNKYAVVFNDEYTVMDSKGYNALRDSVIAFRFATIMANIDNEIPAYILDECYPSLSFSQLDAVLKNGPHKNLPISQPAYNYYVGKKKRQPGQMFIDAELEGMDGKKHKLSEYIGKGNYTVLHFWSTNGWASRTTMSTYMKIAQNYDDSKVRVVGFSLCYSKDDCWRYVENRKMNWTQLYADKHFHNEATKAYGVIAHPESIIFGPDGMIVAEGLQGKALENKIKELVGEMDRKE